jgi:single-stranded-DNA-specific exonuclease
MPLIKEYRWTFPEQDPSVDSLALQETAKRLGDELTISPVLAEILSRRDIRTFEEARSFFRPSFSDLNDPFLMNDMDRAVDRIVQALAKKERILVYGDYDVDGTNGTTLLWTFLKSIGGAVSYFIPDRIKDGYGLSQVGIDRAKELGVTLLISIDCGVTAIEPVRMAQSVGIDVIVCDHHQPGDQFAQPFALLDPLKPTCSFPFKHLSGCGVGFKLIQALCTHETIQSRLTDDPNTILTSYLDLVTLATTADIVRLTGENRALVKLGLDLINSNPRPGIRALIETAGLKPGKITAGQIIFVLAPRINAVGRLGNAMRAVELLTSDSYENALELARVAEEENRNRRKIDEDTFLEAQELVENFLDVEQEGAIVLHQETWHPGVIGIVASRLVEKYYKPTVMMTTIDGVAKGSARSVSGFDIYQALKRCEDTMIQFGGHKYAAGLSVEVSRVKEFKDAFNTVVKELLTEELRTPEIKVDAELNLSELTPKFVRILSQFAPFGPGNMRPVFVVRNVELVGSPRIVGQKHLKFRVRAKGQIIDTIGFNLAHLIGKVPTGRKDIALAFSLDESDYSGEAVPQLKIRDIK